MAIPKRTTFDEVLADLEVLKVLKKQKDLRPALEVALSLVEDAERLGGSGAPPPAYTEEAAIIYRKMRDYDGEVAVLERYEEQCRRAGGPPPGKSGKRVLARLEKARELRDEHALDSEG